MSMATETTYSFWQGERLYSTRYQPIGLDTETEAVNLGIQIPDLALATAYDGNTSVIIHPDDLEAFFTTHRFDHFVAHNVVFDFWVIEKFLTSRSSPAKQILWNCCNEGRLHCSMILDKLVRIADSSVASDHRGFVKNRNLSEVSRTLSHVRPDKEDPYRMRFGELKGLDKTAFQSVDEGFFKYAAEDVIAVWTIYPELVSHAENLRLDYQQCTGNTPGCEIMPDAFEKYGPLTETIQVKAAIVLGEMSMKPVRINLNQRAELSQPVQNEIAELTQELINRFPDVVKKDEAGNPIRSTNSNYISFQTAELENLLIEIEKNLKLKTPIPRSKNNSISKSAKDWEAHQNEHEFLRIWLKLKKLEKEQEFLDKLLSEQLYCNYDPLILTGRTSCSAPTKEKNLPGINIQQIPSRFRSLFIPRQETDQLFIADYNAAELRTLAAICRARYKNSRLADVFTEETDPHAFTAAMIQHMDLNDFMQLKNTSPQTFKAGRQGAKAINFGVPGGLGAAALQKSAKQSYGVDLTEVEARKFKKQLITEIYPELNSTDGYMTDRQASWVAWNLGISEEEVLKTVNLDGKGPWCLNDLHRLLSGMQTYSNTRVDDLWKKLGILGMKNQNPGCDLHQSAKLQKPNPGLARTVFNQRCATLTGRIRDQVSYTEAHNTPFQGLAADGAKLALWNLRMQGYDIYGFIHDEILICLPKTGAQEAATRACQIMEESMAEVLNDVPAKCEYIVAGNWCKP